MPLRLKVYLFLVKHQQELHQLRELYHPKYRRLSSLGNIKYLYLTEIQYCRQEFLYIHSPSWSTSFAASIEHKNRAELQNEYVAVNETLLELAQLLISKDNL